MYGCVLNSDWSEGDELQFSKKELKAKLLLHVHVLY